MKSIRILLTTAMISFALFTFSQTMNEAGEAFNQGINFGKEKNYTAAIEAYNKTIEICDQIGEEGSELKGKAQKQIGTSYYNSGKDLYTAKKYSDAVKDFKLAAENAELAGDTKTVDAAMAYVAGITYAIGNSYLKKEEFDKALEKYNEVLTYDANYFKAYYGMGLVYKKQEDYDQMKAAFEKVIEMGPAEDKTVEKAISVGASTFLNAGAVALQNAKYQDAVNDLTTSLEYADDANAYYYLAVAHNSLSNWNDAVVAANKSIELGVPNRADAFFILGQAYEGAGNSDEACNAYKNVTVGDNLEAAKYQIQNVLKCN